MQSNWVVVVDDDIMSLKNARQLLQQEQMRVSVVRSGGELLTFLQKNRPDLILLDIIMPEMDGFETYSRVRELELENGHPQIPIIFLTGEDNAAVERRGLSVGASDFIHKPFDREVLVTRIRNTIENARTIENLTERASIDRLTGFLNKSSGTVVIRDLCRTETGAMMIIDLDNFKLVNDLYGHEMGDRVLISFADIVRLGIREDDVLCRIGGDEFLAFYKDMRREQDVASLTGRINEQIVQVCRELMGQDYDIPIGASIGAVLVPEQGTDYQLLFQYADKALYQVKMNGKHNCRIYDPEEGADKTPEEGLDEELARMTQVFEERDYSGKAMMIGQDAFTWVYRHMTRFVRRHRGTIMKLLFSLSGKNAEGAEMLPEAVDTFGAILQAHLRRNDVITRSRRNQFFVLLPDATDVNVQIVINRVVKEWEKTEGHEDIQITYAIDFLDFREDNHLT